jgi:TonB family protein
MEARSTGSSLLETRHVASAPSASRSPESATPALAGAQSPASGAQPAADVTVITTRDDFLLELGQTLHGRAGVRPVDSLEAALAGITGGKRGQVLVIDARELADVRAAVAAAHAARPRTVVVVFAEGPLDSSKAFAVLPLPLDTRKTQPVLEAAIADAVANKAAMRAAPAPESSIGALRLQSPTPGAGDEARVARSGLLIAAVAAAVAVAAGAFWYFTRDHGTPLSAAAPTSASPAAASPAAATAAAAASDQRVAPLADTSIVQGKVDELLEKARLAMHERRFTEPAGDNALLYYRSAAAADAGNSEAHDGLQRVAGVLAARFEEALGAGRLDEAALTLANFKAASAGDARTAAFELHLYSAQIARAMGDGNVDRAAALVRQAQQSAVPAEQIARWRADITRRQEDARVQRLAGLIDDRIRDGNLTEGDDSAKAYVQQLETAAPANAATQRAAHALLAACLHRAREAALAGNRADEDRWLDEARGAGAKPADIAAFQKELAGARQKAAQAENEHLLQLVHERLQDGRLTEPAQDSAAWYLTQLQASDAANAGLATTSRELAQRLLERVRTAALAGKPDDADLAQAKRWGADPKDVAAVQQLQPSAASKTAAIDPASLAASLKRVRVAPPDYPASAMAGHITGSVTLDYTVDTRGETRDIRVVEAAPPQVFDQAAINAVKRWRYAPMIVNGAAIEVPVRTHIRFELPR